MSNTTDVMHELYSIEGEPHVTAFTPYRVCPIGAHTDHQLGKVTGFAIDRGVRLVCVPTEDGSIELSSLQFPNAARFTLDNVPPTPVGDWADYLRGATIALAASHSLRVGMRGVIEGELPIGGLSSSAAVTISYLNALCRLNEVALSADEMVKTARAAENNYVGVSCGKLDQSCEVYCVADHLLYMDMLDDRFENIPAPPTMKPYKIAVFFSGIERTLVGSGYNTRVDECRSAAYALKAYAGMEYGKFAETNLRDVPYEVYQGHKSRLPETWARRAEHWYGEMARVERGAEAWRRGDIEEFGRISFESGRSSIELWETGSPELVKLYEIMTHVDGIYGGRFSGAGFKGCCVALIDPSFEENIIRQVTSEYLSEFPQLSGRFSVHLCATHSGVGGVREA